MFVSGPAVGGLRLSAPTRGAALQYRSLGCRICRGLSVVGYVGRTLFCMRGRGLESGRRLRVCLRPATCDLRLATCGLQLRPETCGLRNSLYDTENSGTVRSRSFVLSVLNHSRVTGRGRPFLKPCSRSGRQSRAAPWPLPPALRGIPCGPSVRARQRAPRDGRPPSSRPPPRGCSCPCARE